MIGDRLLTLPQVAEELACSLSTVKRLVRAKRLLPVRIRVDSGRGCVRVRASDLSRYILLLEHSHGGNARATATPAVGVVLAPGERLTDERP